MSFIGSVLKRCSLSELRSWAPSSSLMMYSTKSSGGNNDPPKVSAVRTSNGSPKRVNVKKTSTTASVESAKESSPEKLHLAIEPNVAAGNEYRVPEYYAHNTFSYTDYDIDMMKMRLTQPSAGNRRPA